MQSRITAADATFEHTHTHSHTHTLTHTHTYTHNAMYLSLSRTHAHTHTHLLLDALTAANAGFAREAAEDSDVPLEVRDSRVAVGV